MKTKSATAKQNGGMQNGKKNAMPGSATGSSANGSSATKNKGAMPQNTKSPAGDPEAATGLKTLFTDMLKDIYWAEKALTKALPKMAKNATSPELKDALQEHLTVTQEQISRLEQVFEIIGKKAQAKKCDAMEGLIKEAEGMMEENEGMVRDAAIIAAGQKVEHYEIATYGTLVAFAKILGEDEALDLLTQTLEEEKEADEKLTEVAETAVNIQANEEESDDEDEEEEDEDDEEDEEEDDEEEDDDDAEESADNSPKASAKAQPKGKATTKK